MATKDSTKTKTAVLAALVVGLLGVGVFQFTQSGSPQRRPPKAEEKGAPEAKETEITAELPTFEAMGVTPQDPFRPIPLNREQSEPGNEPKVVQAPPETPATSRPSVPYRGPSLPAPSNLPPMPAGSGVISAGAPLRAQGEFAYRLVGIVNGPRPCAVFQDDAGNQKLVRQGEAVDSGSHVVSVSDTKVVVRSGGKQITLRVGGSN